MTYRTAEYTNHLSSGSWRSIAYRKKRSVGFRCERCPEKATEVHHIHYRTLGVEKLDDLEALCWMCHYVADYERDEESSTRSSNALWNARLNGWARKKYGDDWDLDAPEDVADEFEDWLESKEEGRDW